MLLCYLGRGFGHLGDTRTRFTLGLAFLGPTPHTYMDGFRVEAFRPMAVRNIGDLTPYPPGEVISIKTREIVQSFPRERWPNCGAEEPKSACGSRIWMT